METDINKIRKLSKEKEDENWEFRSFLNRLQDLYQLLQGSMTGFRSKRFRLVNVIENCSICPIVFNVYEYLKDEIK